jgi:hypothetical protein
MVAMSSVGRCEGELTPGSRTVTAEEQPTVLRGRCHHPRDIEVTAEQASLALRPDCSAAFTTLVGEAELLVLAHEVSRQAWPVDVSKVADAIRTAVAAEHGVQVYAVVLLPPHGLPTPPSGTIQRDLCAEMYGKGQLPELSRSVLDDPSMAGTARLQHAATDPSSSRNELTREPWRNVAPSVPHGRTSRWYRWVGGSRSPNANVLDREFMFPHVPVPQAPARRVTTPPRLAG